MENSTMASVEEEVHNQDATGESLEEESTSGRNSECVGLASEKTEEAKEKETNLQTESNEGDVGTVNTEGHECKDNETEKIGEKEGGKETEKEDAKETDGHKQDLEKKEVLKENKVETQEDVKDNGDAAADKKEDESKEETSLIKEKKCEKDEKTGESPQNDKSSDTKHQAQKTAVDEVVSKEKGAEETNKEKSKEKQEKPKGKSGVTPSFYGSRTCLQTSSRQRSVRPSARRDAMAKFQQDQTPGVRNFKVQKTSAGLSAGASIKQKILQWCSSKTRDYEGVSIENFSSSWSNGLAFCALVHRFYPSAFDFSSLKASEREKNFTLAFSMAESLAGCCPLLDVSDMLLMGNKPDPFSVFTYVQSLCQHLSKIERERKEKEKAEQAKSQDETEAKAEGEGKEPGEAETPEKKEGEEQGEVDKDMTEGEESDEAKLQEKTDELEPRKTETQEKKESEEDPDEGIGGPEEDNSTKKETDQNDNVVNIAPETETCK